MSTMLEDLAAIQSAERAAEFIDKHRRTIAQNAEDSKRLKALEQAMDDLVACTWLGSKAASSIRGRDDELMREWGFDSGEVE